MDIYAALIIILAILSTIGFIALSCLIIIKSTAVTTAERTRRRRSIRRVWNIRECSVIFLLLITMVASASSLFVDIKWEMGAIAYEGSTHVTGLTPGKNYTVTGHLMFKDDGSRITSAAVGEHEQDTADISPIPHASDSDDDAPSRGSREIGLSSPNMARKSCRTTLLVCLTIVILYLSITTLLRAVRYSAFFDLCRVAVYLIFLVLCYMSAPVWCIILNGISLCVYSIERIARSLPESSSSLLLRHGATCRTK